MEHARQLITSGTSKAVSLSKRGASIWNDYHQAETGQPMKYLARKAFQCGRLGPGAGAVMSKTPNAQIWGYPSPKWRPQRCSSHPESGAVGPQGTLSLTAHRLVWEHTGTKAFPGTHFPRSCCLLHPSPQFEWLKALSYRGKEGTLPPEEIVLNEVWRFCCHKSWYLFYYLFLLVIYLLEFGRSSYKILRIL